MATQCGAPKKQRDIPKATYSRSLRVLQRRLILYDAAVANGKAGGLRKTVAIFGMQTVINLFARTDFDWPGLISIVVRDLRRRSAFV